MSNDDAHLEEKGGRERGGGGGGIQDGKHHVHVCSMLLFGTHPWLVIIKGLHVKYHTTT